MNLDQLHDQADAIYPGGLLVARNVHGVPPAGGDGLLIPIAGEPGTYRVRGSVANEPAAFDLGRSQTGGQLNPLAKGGVWGPIQDVPLP